MRAYSYPAGTSRRWRSRAGALPVRDRRHGPRCRSMRWQRRGGSVPSRAFRRETWDLRSSSMSLIPPGVLRGDTRKTVPRFHGVCKQLVQCTISSRICSIKHIVVLSFAPMMNGKKVGFTAGAFDLCHAGHMLMFEEAKTVCDYLIVGLHSDPTIDRPDTKNKPIMSVEERKIILNSVRWIAEGVVYDTESDLLNILTENKLGIDIRILGVEYKE